MVRIINTYGPRMLFNDGRVFSNFIVQALKGESITIYGDGNHTRSFCYVSDRVSGLIQMMNSDEDFTGTVNLGNPHEISTLALAEKIIFLTKSRIESRPLPADDPSRRRPDIRLAEERLGWSPRVPLEAGLSETIRFFREALYS